MGLGVVPIESPRKKVRLLSSVRLIDIFDQRLSQVVHAYPASHFPGLAIGKLELVILVNKYALIGVLNQ